VDKYVSSLLGSTFECFVDCYPSTLNVLLSSDMSI
jgi:hypothetical protein